MERFLARFTLAVVAALVLMQALAIHFGGSNYLKTVRNPAMSWRPKPNQTSANISIQEMKGMLEASNLQTDTQMAKELEKKGYVVKKPNP